MSFLSKIISLAAKTPKSPSKISLHKAAIKEVANFLPLYGTLTGSKDTSEDELEHTFRHLQHSPHDTERSLLKGGWHRQSHTFGDTEEFNHPGHPNSSIMIQGSPKTALRLVKLTTYKDRLNNRYYG